MEITIKNENGDIAIREGNGCKEHEVINAYSVALAMKCNAMFKTKEAAFILLKKAYEVSEEILNDMYDK